MPVFPLLRLCLAFCLLASDETPPITLYAMLVPTLNQLGQSANLFAPEERFCDDTCSWEIPKQIRHIRDCWRDPNGLPVLLFNNRFDGHRTDVLRQLETNWRYQEYLQIRIRIQPWRRDLRQALEDADLLYDIWNAIDDLRNRRSWRRQRESIMFLRRTLGEEAFHLGQAPPMLPYWHMITP